MSAPGAASAEFEVESCWTTIGVWGDQSPRCPLLEQVIHCQNCDVYVSAGRALLERELPPRYAREWTRVLAEAKTEEEGERQQLLVFRVESEWLGLAAGACREVTSRRAIRRVPHVTDRAFLGLVNVRGELHMTASLRELLELDGGADADREAAARRSHVVYPRLVVAEEAGGRWAFPAAEVFGIHTVGASELIAAPATVRRDRAAYTRALFEWRETTVAWLDHEALFAGLDRRFPR